jgi:predicted polyphosphate/ATP-dependent NAD kinase
MPEKRLNIKSIGLIINPIAGIGGKVALKGSDGEMILAKALALGAVPESKKKAAVTLKIMADAIKSEIEIFTYPGEMGEDAAREAGFFVTVLGSIEKGHTTPADTIRSARDLRDAGVELILFAGGDGTARNILDAIGTQLPVLGIPTGCKIHSAVYAINPKTAGDLIVQYVQGLVKETRDAEVMDINEDLFRDNILDARLYGYLKVPEEKKMVQNLKSGRGLSETSTIAMLSNYIVDNMESDVLYIIGPGSTMWKLLDSMGLEGTMLGVDLVVNRKLLMKDVTEEQILEALDHYKKAVIIVTVIGGQGYVFGRGNQQISARVIKRVGRENIKIAASKAKMLSLFGKSLYVDTGDEEVNRDLCGYYKVIVGNGEYHVFKVTD